MDYLQNHYPIDFFKAPVNVIGKIANIPEKNALGVRFLLSTKKGDLQLSWYQHQKQVQPGEIWQFTVKLKPIHGFHNPGGFNTERWAKMKGIAAKGYVLQHANAKLLHRHFSVNRWRQALQRNIHRSVKEPAIAGTLNALTIGSKSLLSPEDWLVFQRTGTSHLIAISGLHVGMVFAMVYFVLCGIFRCFPPLLLHCPAQRLAALGSLLIVWIYGFLVDFSLPTQRAVIMVTAFVLASVSSRPISVWWRLSFAFVMVLAWQPLAIFSPSFWLSFLAVFWLAYAALVKRRMQFVLALGLLPVTLFCFHQFSLVSVVSNLVAIPWVTLLIVPLCLLAVIVMMFSVHGATLLWWLAGKCLLPLWRFLEWLSHFSWSIWQHSINDFFIMAAALLAVAFMFAPRGLPLRFLGLVLLIPLLVSTPKRPKVNTFWLTVLDVGQGLSAVVRTAKHVLVYDAGPRFVTGFDAGRSIVLPYLQTVGIYHVDTLMVSHGDNDHIGGSFWLVKHIPVDQIYSSIPHSRWHRSFQHCYAGQQWQWDGVNFQVVWPLKNSAYQDNNSSCVLRVSVGQHAILLTGDIEKPAEEALIATHAVLTADILVAPHHGSRSSSSEAFIKHVDPKQVIFPVGYRNRYHFPAVSVLKRYRDWGANLLSTVKLGAIKRVVQDVHS